MSGIFTEFNGLSFLKILGKANYKLSKTMTWKNINS